MNVKIQILDFDNTTGQLSNLRSFNVSYLGGGLEFSPDDSKFYTGGPVQYDMTVPTQSAIQSSMTILVQSSSAQMAGMQMGLDGKIYGNTYDGASESYYMSVIHDPNAPGALCNHEDSAVYLEGKRGGVSVPQFLSSYYYTNFYADTVCIDQPSEFYINFSFIDSVYWDFGDPASGALNNDTALNPSHTYADTGAYTVTLIAKNGVKTDTIIKQVYVKAPPQIDLGTDRAGCSLGDSLVISSGLLHARAREGTYEWSPFSSQSDSTLLLTGSELAAMNGTPTFVSLSFTNECGSDEDTVLIHPQDAMHPSLPKLLRSCEDSLVLSPFDTAVAPAQYAWRSNGVLLDSGAMGSTGVPDVLFYREQNLFHGVVLSYTNSCGTFEDSCAVSFLPFADGTLPEDSTHCSDQAFTILHPQTEGIAYRWNDGSTDPSLLIQASGTYWLRSESQCDTLVDSFAVSFIPLGRVHIAPDTHFCPGDSLRVTANTTSGFSDVSFHWSHGDSGALILISDTGIYRVTASLAGCETSDSAFFGERGDCYNRCKPFIPNVFSPNGDGVNEVFSTFMSCRCSSFQLSVFNRWGQRVFYTEDLDERWDGMMNAAPAPEGVYYYECWFLPVGTTQHRTYQGSFTLMR